MEAVGPGYVVPVGSVSSELTRCPGPVTGLTRRQTFDALRGLTIRPAERLAAAGPPKSRLGSGPAQRHPESQKPRHLKTA